MTGNRGGTVSVLFKVAARKEQICEQAERADDGNQCDEQHPAATLGVVQSPDLQRERGAEREDTIGDVCRTEGEPPKRPSAEIV